MRILYSVVFLTLILNIKCEGQGYNHQWLLGSYDFLQDPKGRITIDSLNFNPITEYRKMPFKGTEGNICDANGNLLMSSNGIWIANANNDTMMNGSGLNPGGITPNWPYGLPMVGNNVFIPHPIDSSRYILLHHSATFNGVYSPANSVFQSIIDITLDSGLGGVILKNDLILQDTLNWGIGMCKHANGRDWWAVVIKDSSDQIFKILLDSGGVNSVTSQSLNYQPLPWGNAVQLTFSPNGNKFCSTTYSVTASHNGSIVLCDFDRCNGNFSNTQVVLLNVNDFIFGLAFSASGRFVYACSSYKIFQVDLTTLAVDTVATFDGFISPPGSGCCYTDFWNMYLAANGKIYNTSGSSVQHLHVINYPDSAGLACDVQQHAIDLVDYRQLSAVPNHPNYYLGCDTTLGCPCLSNVGINEFGQHDFRFRVYPNPVVNNYLHIGYQLPQNRTGTFQVYDIAGKVVFNFHLPQWSNEQSFLLPSLSEGLYFAVITSGNYRVSKKFAVMK